MELALASAGACATRTILVAARADEAAGLRPVDDFFIDTGRPLLLRHLPYRPRAPHRGPRAELIDPLTGNRAGQGGLHFLADALARHGYRYRLGTNGQWEKKQ